MLQTSDDYKIAISARKRRIQPSSLLEVIDPDLQYNGADGSQQARYSRPEQLYNMVMDLYRYATLEPGRWKLDGTFDIFPDSVGGTGEIGFVCDDLCDEAGLFATTQIIALHFSGVSILQTASVHFSKDPLDGVARDFTFSIYSGDSIGHSETISGNSKNSITFDGFTVENPTRIQIDITKWGIGRRKARVVDIIPGIYDACDAGSIYSIDVIHQADFTNLTVPYGSANLVLHNENMRFNPYIKTSILKSIEERQPVKLWYSIYLYEIGRWEKVPVGVFFQKDGGAETNAYGLTISFQLIDIVGLLQKKEYTPPATLPTTVKGWIESIVGQLGTQFQAYHKIDPTLENVGLTIASAYFPSQSAKVRCGDLVRYICMAIGAYFCADPATGFLKVAPFPATTAKTIDTKNTNEYPKNTAAAGVAEIAFQLYDAAKTKYTVAGANQIGSTINISNPFLVTTAQADAVAAQILSFYNASSIEVKWRGDMGMEIADIATIETGFGVNVMARVQKQQLPFSNGVLKQATSTFLEVQST